MSTDYRVFGKLAFADLFDGRLEKYGIREINREDKSETCRSVQGRDGFLVVYDHEDEVSLTRKDFCAIPFDVFHAIESEFDVRLVSEYEPQYWGFETKEEWRAFERNFAKEHDIEYHQQILKFIRGHDDHGILAGTIGMAEANIAKELVEEQTGLLADDQREALLTKIRDIYSERYVRNVTFGDSDRSIFQLMETSWTDMPKA